VVEIDQLVSASTDSPRTVAISRTNRSAPFIRWSAWIDVIGVAYILGTWACFVVLRPDLNPLSHYLSEYVHGPYGTLMTSTFAVLGFAWAMLAAGLFRTITPAGRSWFGLGVLALGSALTFGMGLFPTEPSGAAPTMAGTLHRLLAKLFFVSICPGILALTIAWRCWAIHSVKSQAFRMPSTNNPITARANPLRAWSGLKRNPSAVLRISR